MQILKPRIICEEFLDDGNEVLTDYKVFCFKGEPHFIQVIKNRGSSMTQDFYNVNWDKMNISKGGHGVSKKEIEKPYCLNEMIEISRKLAADFSFVRIDFYIVNNKPIFGELTFTPAGGLSPFEPIEKDLEIASLIDLDAYSN